VATAVLTTLNPASRAAARGWSDIEGGAFFDPAADAALFSAIEETFRQTDRRRLVRLPLHINDPRFAEAAVAEFREIAKG
jgi:uncharacterized protein (UPF0261 family)